MHLDFNDGTPKIMYKTTSRVRKFTKQRVFFIFKAGADCVAMVEPSKLSCIESKVGGFCAKMDPAVGVLLFDKYLADLMNSK